MNDPNFDGTKIAVAAAQQGVKEGTNLIKYFLEPRQMVKYAEAEANAKLAYTTTLYGIKRKSAQELELARLIESTKIKNIEKIIDKSRPLINVENTQIQLDDDWFLSYFDKASNYSDEEMQDLWAKILAGEINEPRSFSKRTLRILEQLDKKEAETFNSIKSFQFIGDNNNPYIVIFDTESEIYLKRGIDVLSLSELIAHGLIFELPTGSFGDVYSLCYDEEIIELYYGEKKIKLKILPSQEDSIEKEPQYFIYTGKYFLTKSGIELLKVCDSSPDDSILAYTLSIWEKGGIVVISLE